MPIHLAILKKPYLDLILDGRKTVECRLTRIACAPYRRIHPGETVLLKQSAGPVRGRARVAAVHYFESLTPPDVRKIQRKYNHKILADEDYWHAKKDSRFGSLIELEAVTPLKPYRIKSTGRQAWIVQPDHAPKGL